MREVQAGLWFWQARHPDWTPSQGGDRLDGWGPDVTSYAIDDGERLLLFDPLAVPAPIIELAASRETAIVLTCTWHARDARSLAEQLGAPIYVPPPDEGDPDPLEGHVFSAGDSLPIGVKAFPGREPNDLVLWVKSRRALVVGDTLLDHGHGDGLVFPTTWMPKGVAPEVILASLQELLELPVELVLPTHGEPTDRAALERALA